MWAWACGQCASRVACGGGVTDFGVERHGRARSPGPAAGGTHLANKSHAVSRLRALFPHLVAVCALWQGNPGGGGAGEKSAFSPSPLWAPKVLPAGVYLRGGRAGPLPGPGTVTQGADREVQSNAESQHPGLRPQAIPREAPGSVPAETLKNLFAVRGSPSHTCVKGHGRVRGVSSTLSG